MVIRVPESKASMKQNQVEIVLPGEAESYWIPKVQFLLADQRNRMTSLAMKVKDFIAEKGSRQPDEEERDALVAMEALQREILETHIPGIYEKCTQDQIEYIMTSWNEESGISVGESGASANS